MEFSGRFVSISRDLSTGDYIIVLSVRENALELYQKIKDCLLDISIKKFRKKRSLSANAYLWVLLQKMAEALHTTKDDLYLQMLDRHGQFTHIVVKPNVVDRVKDQWRMVRDLGEITVNGQKGVQLQCYFGSSTYNTQEMAALIDGVVDECKELGIETLPPDEIERMKQEWGVDIAERSKGYE